MHWAGRGGQPAVVLHAAPWVPQATVRQEATIKKATTGVLVTRMSSMCNTKTTLENAHTRNERTEKQQLLVLSNSSVLACIVEVEAALLHGLKIPLAYTHVTISVCHAICKIFGLLGTWLLLLDNLLCCTNCLCRLWALSRRKHRIHCTVGKCRASTECHACRECMKVDELLPTHQYGWICCQGTRAPRQYKAVDDEMPNTLCNHAAQATQHAPTRWSMRRRGCC